MSNEKVSHKSFTLSLQCPKRLHPKSNGIGNTLMKKLEPTLPLPRRQNTFKSPYKCLKGLDLSEKKKEEAPYTQKNEQQIRKTMFPRKTFKSTLTYHEGLLKHDKNTVVSSSNETSICNASPVKIQPIDPYEFSVLPANKITPASLENVKLTKKTHEKQVRFIKLSILFRNVRHTVFVLFLEKSK